MGKDIATSSEGENEMLSLAMQREQYGWYFTILFWMACWNGAGVHVYLFLLLCIPLIHYVYRFLSADTLSKYRLVIVSVYFEVIQLLHYKWASAQPQEAFSFFQCSTVILVLRQLSPVLPWPVKSYLIVKHIVVWYVCCLGGETLTNMSAVTYVNLCWAIFHMYTHMAIQRRVVESECSQLQALHRKENHIAALYDASPNGILVMTEENKVVTYNSMLLQLLDVEMTTGVEEEVYSNISQLKYISEYTTGESYSEAPVLTDIMNYIVSGKKGQNNIGVVLINGKYLEWTVKKLEWDLKKACIICVRDITRWVELENIAKRESNSKSALIRSVSHELRTPTNAIINIVQDMKNKEEFTHESQQDMLMLSSAAQFLLSMINDLLDYSSITNGKFGLTKQYFSLKDTVTECVQLIEQQCKHKKLELAIRYDSLIPALVYNDKNRLKQVILNLLSNAMKFTIAGNIEMIAVSVSESHAGIRVRDTGVGISEESIGKIFQLFGKLEGNEKLNPQGCGLGLSISSMLVKSMGGSSIHVKSKRCVGSLFGFEFNITEDDNANQSPELPIKTDSTDLGEAFSQIILPREINVTSKHVFSEILIADDVDFNRIVLRKILESVGYDCDEAPTGVQVIQLVKYRANMGKPYLVILMDVEMPEMDGIAATRELSAMVTRGELASFPLVIGCSAYSSMEDRDACLQAGMQYYLEKPVAREVLFHLLTSLVPNLEVLDVLH